jgi:hypothetical protein
LHIEGDSELVGVEVKEEPAELTVSAVVQERASSSRAVADSGGFDLDDLCAEISQQLGTIRTRHQAAEFDNL